MYLNITAEGNIGNVTRAKTFGKNEEIVKIRGLNHS
jgi:hypothetical protein